MSAQEQIALKRQTMAQQQKEASELGSMLAEMRKMQMASLMGSQGKSTVILTDQTDLGDKLKGMVESFQTAVKGIDTTQLNDDQLKSLKSLEAGVEKLTKAIYLSTNDARGNNADIIKAIKALDLSPVINLPAPIVNIPAQKTLLPATNKVDLKPLQDTLHELLSPKEASIDLSCYRAQDLKESGDIQYVGFVNPEGHWYIIENDTKKNTLRYVFGSKGYAAHFRSAATYVYKVMDKAIASAS